MTFDDSTLYDDIWGLIVIMRVWLARCIQVITEGVEGMKCWWW